MIILYVIFIFISYVCRECELCVHGSNGYPRSVFLSRKKKKISRKISTPVNPTFTIFKMGCKGV